MADNHFDLVIVWDNLGGAVRVNAGGQATVTDPGTGALVTVVQGGQSVSTVTADKNGRVSFVAQQGIVKLTSGGLSMVAVSSEQATAGAANAAAAQSAQTAAESARDDAVAARDDVNTGLAGKVAKADFLLNVKDYGAKGDGTTDDTAAIQSAINDAQSKITDNAGGRQEQGFTVYFPRGKYRLTSGLTVSGSNITLAGASPSASVLYAASPAFDLVTFNHATLSLYNCGVRGLRFSTPGNATAGNHLVVKRAIYFMAEDLIFNGWYGGLYLGGVGKFIGSGLIFAQEVRTGGTTAQAIKVASDAFLSGDIHFTDVQVMQDTAVGANAIVVTGVDGLYLNNSHWHGTFSVNPSNTGNETTVASVHLTGCYLDGSSGDLVELIGTASTAYRNLRFVNCYFRSAGLRGLRIEPTTSTVSRVLVSACTFSENTRNAIDTRVSNVADVLVTGCIFVGNNTANGSSWGDVNLNGDGVTLGHCVFTGGGSTGYGLGVAASATDVMVDGISFANSTVASKVANNAGSAVSFKGILGWKVRNRGTQAVGSGVTSVTVTHGLNLTPTLEAIRVTPQGSVPAWWVSAVTASAFTLNFASATSAAVNVGWSVDMEF